MNREFLEKLGLEKDTIDKIMAEHGKAITDYKAKASEVDTLKEQNKDYKEQLSERDEQLKELKKVDADALQDKIKELEQLNETTQKEYEQKIEEQAFDHKLETTLAGADVHNAKAVKALLDLDIVKLKDGELDGLDHQLTALKESDPYLFKEENDGQQTGFQVGKIGGDGQGNALPKNPFSKKHFNLTEQGRLYRENRDLYDKLKAQAE